LLFLSFDIPFFVANLTKFLDGGYIPVVVGVVFFVVMVIWHQGRTALFLLLEERTEPFAAFLAALPERRVARVSGTAIYLSPSTEVPFTLVMQSKRVRSIADHVVLLRVVIEHEPQVAEARRVEVEKLEQGFARITLHFGYMENPAIPPVLEAAVEHAGLPRIDDATYYIGRETFLSGKGGRMKPLAESLFAFLARNAKSAIDHFGLPPERVVELGIRVDL
jgi:KUP system potassium uptake protein